MTDKPYPGQSTETQRNRAMNDDTLTLRLSPEDQLELVRRRFGGADIADDAAAAVPEPEPW